MASIARKTAAKAAGSESLEPAKDAIIDPRDTAKYLLRVTAGPSYDASTHGLVDVNGDSYIIDSDLVTASLNIRIRDYHGLPRSSPSTHPYFSHPIHQHDRYSISFSFTPKKDIPGEDLVMGFDFDRPIRDRLPPLFKPALKLVTTVIDPGIYCDAYADKPYLYGAALSSFYILSVGDKSDPPSRSSSGASSPPRKNRVVQEGAEGNGINVRKQMGLPENSEKRRKFFLKHHNLESFTFEAGREYESDFFNPYLDFSNFAVRLPGFSISVAKYIDEKTHTLRYVLKNRKTGEVYFVVVFTLLFGQELKDAMKGERAKYGEPEPETVNGTQQRERSGSDRSLDEKDPQDQEGLVASLGRWLPKILRSGGTASGGSTPSERRSSSMEQQIDQMGDEKVEEGLRDLHVSAKAQGS